MVVLFFIFRIFSKNYTHAVFHFLGIFFTAKKSIFNAKNENSGNSESSENSENSQKILTAMGSYRNAKVAGKGPRKSRGKDPPLAKRRA